LAEAELPNKFCNTAYSDGLSDVPVLCSVLTYSSNNQWEAEKINNAHTIGCNSVGWCPTVSNGKRFVV
jgi:hypothetical protein